MKQVSEETIRYLDSIGSRVRAYHNSTYLAKEYILRETILDQEMIVNLIIMALLWTAAVREEVLTEEELFMFLGFECIFEEDKVISMADHMKSWSIDEVFDYVVDNF